MFSPFLKNKYTRWYFTIIDKARGRSLVGYTERHHIIPTALGGTNHSDNLIVLTPREHFVCHRLLTKMTIGKSQKSMVHAFWLMTTMNSKVGHRYAKLTASAYAKLREAHACAISQKLTGTKWTAERRAAGKRPVTDETKRKMSLAKIGKTFSPEHCFNLKHAKGKRWINKNGMSKMITVEQLSKHHADGWQNGRGNTQKRRMHLG